MKKYFIFIVILLLSYAIYDYQIEKSNQKTKIEKSIIVPFKVDQIQKFEISSKDKKIRLQRSSGGWVFAEPLTENADNEMVMQFLEGVVTEKSQEEILSDSDVYGFDQPLATLTFINNLSESISIRVAAKKNFEGNAFLRKNQDNQVLVGSSTWFQRAEKTDFDFRDRRWARLKSADIHFFKIKKGNQSFSIKKTEDIWSSIEKPKLKLDQNKIRSFLKSLGSNNIQNFNFKADSMPLIYLQVLYGDNKVWNAEFGIDQDKKHYMKINDPNIIAEIFPQDADELYKVSLQNFTLKEEKKEKK